MGKFSALAANVAETHRVELIDPITEDVLKDKDGNAAYIDVLSMESETGRAFDAEQRKRAFRQARKSRSGLPDDIDPREENQQKLARLTKGWHLVDPNTREVLDVECNAEAALELYSEPGMDWIFRQVLAEAANAGNFLRKSGSTTSLISQGTSSGVSGV